MNKKTWRLSEEDAEKLVSYACRYRSMTTVVDEQNGAMNVYTTFAGNDKSTSVADRFTLEKVSDESPRMPKEEYERRVEGKFPEPQRGGGGSPRPRSRA
jgi:hypothetical protein